MTALNATRDATYYRIVDERVGLLDDAVTEGEFRASLAGLRVDVATVEVDDCAITMLMLRDAHGAGAGLERVVVAEAICVVDELAELLADRGRDLDTHIAFCGGCHLRVARGWRRMCVRCEQQIATGNLGR